MCELADILEEHGEAYRRTHTLSFEQHKVMRAVTACRTPALGGQCEWCEDCGYERYVYHSCRNRHCPKCQTRARLDWVEARQAELLPVPYFHHVFTLPHQLNPLILYTERNQRALLTLLFDAVAQTLHAFGKKSFGGKLGFTLVLHTWDQQLRPHFHLHGLVASGALAPGRSRWIAGGARFLFPVRALSVMFRGKLLAGLQALLASNALDLPPDLADVCRPDRVHDWCPAPWVVYAKAPFAGPETCIEYLGRYTHRVAISNDRILDCEDGEVRFNYRDRADGDRQKIATLPVDTFIQRFLHHVLPSRFLRIRHYGFLANRSKKPCLNRCRVLLAVRQTTRKESPSSVEAWLLAVCGVDPTRCPLCGGPLAARTLLPEAVRPGARQSGVVRGHLKAREAS